MKSYNCGDIVQIIDDVDDMDDFENHRYKVIISNTMTVTCVSLDNNKLTTIHKSLLMLDIVYVRKQKLKQLRS